MDYADISMVPISSLGVIPLEAEGVEYSPGEVLELTLTWSNDYSYARNFYMVGGLFDRAKGDLIPESVFGVYLAEGASVAVNSQATAGKLPVTLFVLQPGAQVQLPCQFTFGYSDCIMVILLFSCTTTTPSVDDPQEGAWTMVLTVPAMTSMIQTLMPMIMMVMMVGMIIPLTKSFTKEG